MFNLSFSERGLCPRRTVKDWIWRYKQYPLFRPETVLIAEENNEIIGSIILEIQDFKVKDRTFKVGILEDAMTHPKFARKGICSNLTSQAIDVARSLEVDLIEAFPQYHNPTYRIFKRRFDFQEASEINILLKPSGYLKALPSIPKLMTSQYLRGFMKSLVNPKSLMHFKDLPSFFHKESRSKTKLIRNYMKGDESQIVAIMNQCLGQMAGYSKRTLEYWRWRYSLRPSFKPEHIFLAELKNQIVGHVAISFQDYVIPREGVSIRVVFVCDFCRCNNQSNRERQIERLLLTRACSYAGINDGLLAIAFTCTRDIQTTDMFRRFGFYGSGTFPALIRSLSEDFSVDSVQSEQLYVPVESIIK